MPLLVLKSTSLSVAIASISPFPFCLGAPCLLQHLVPALVLPRSEKSADGYRLHLDIDLRLCVVTDAASKDYDNLAFQVTVTAHGALH